LEIFSFYISKSRMAQSSNRNSADAEIINNDVINPGSIKSRTTTARNDGDEIFEAPPKLGKGIVASKSFSQFAKNDAITNVEEQQTLDNSHTQNGEMRIFSEELFETNKLAQRLCRKRKFSRVEGASNAEEPVPKRRRLSSFVPPTK
jgi:hypothetical protein